MKTLIALLVLLSLITACGGNDDRAAACDELRDEIDRLFRINTDSRVLDGSAIPCGEDGVANRPDYFDSRVPPAMVESIGNQFRVLCEEFGSQC
jgi:hypothetical protein